MNKFLFFIFVVLICNSSCIDSGSDKDASIYKEYYLNGNLKLEGEVKNGKYNGEVREFFSNGKIKSKASFIDDIKVGKYNEYYKSGNVSKKTFFNADGKMDSIYVEFFDNNELKVYTIVNKGYKNQLFREYYENGSLQSLMFYENDTLQGECKAFHSNGVLAFVGQYVDGLEDGVWFFYAEDSVLLNKKIYKKGKIINIVRECNLNSV